MKILAAADIHGSKYHCALLIEAFAREGADKLLLLGDTLTPGYDACQDLAETAALLNTLSSHIICVCGNCDWPGNQQYLDFPCQAEYALLGLGSHTIFATHGHIYNQHHLPPLPFDILLHGHTHVPEYQLGEGFLYLNPGSVSRPRGISVNSYLLLQEQEFIWKDLHGNPFSDYFWPL